MLPLFKEYPVLKEKLPYVALGIFPTPVKHLKKLGSELGVSGLYLKNDGVSGQSYGGNKVRKLEFILADALEKKAESVLTFGYAGSNHALATSIYAKKLGLTSISVLLKQPNATYVRRNLLMGKAAEAILCHYSSEPAAYLPVLVKLLKQKIQTGRFPYIIPPGGSSCLGIMGYVNAAYELKDQIENGELPEPDIIYIALGTMGTAVGLLLGLRAAGLQSKIVSVRVTDVKYANPKKFKAVFNKVAGLISSKDSSFPSVTISDEDMTIVNDFFGKQYARFTPEGMSAVERLKETEGITLEGTYTGKTMAAMLSHLEDKPRQNKNILFWNTFNAVDFLHDIDAIDYNELPESFHCYFKEDVQPLDKS